MSIIQYKGGWGMFQKVLFKKDHQPHIRLLLSEDSAPLTIMNLKDYVGIAKKAGLSKREW